LIGEAPGEDEDNSVTPEKPLGQAFIGRAGQRLDYTLAGVGLPRSEVSVANVMPRRPLTPACGKCDACRRSEENLCPKRDNREPTKNEIKANADYVRRLVQLHPNLKVVGLLGGTALTWCRGVEKIESYRGDEFFDQGIWWVPTYHPAAVLRRPSNIKWFVQDLEWIKTLADGNLLDLSRLEKEIPFVDDGAVLRTQYFSNIIQSPLSYVDVETAADPPASALWWWDPRVRPVLISLAWFENSLPCAVVVEVNDTTIPVLQDLFKAKPEHWVGQSVLYYDIPLLERWGMSMQCERSVIDSYPIARLNDENRGCGLKDLAKHHLRVVNYTPWWGDAAGEAWHLDWIRWPEMSAVERTERVAYSGKDALVGIQVAQIEADRLRRTPDLVQAYKDLAVWQARAVTEMSRVGMPLDIEAAVLRALFLASEMAEVDQRLQTIVPDEAKKPKKARRRKGEPEPSLEYERINLGSYVQISRLLFTVAGLPKGKTTSKGDKESTDIFALLRVLGMKDSLPDAPPWAFDLIEGVLKHRALEKKKGYVEALVDAASLSHDGRVHSTFKAGPVTWRIASEDPNIQQLPGDIKELFVAPEGWTFVKFDVSGLEVCGLADQAPEQKLVHRIRAGEDLHWRHACSIMGWDYDVVPKDADGKPIPQTDLQKQTRKAIKTLFFASGYGGGPNKLADTLREDFYKAGIGLDVVAEILTARGVKPGKDPFRTLAEVWLKWLDTEYPTLKKAFRRIAAETAKRGYVRGKFHIERRLPEIRDYDDSMRMEAERQAYNFTPQNLSCLTFLAYRELWKIRRDMELEDSVFLVVQEHDSKVWLVREEVAGLWAPVVKHVMENPNWDEWGATFLVPIRVEGQMDRQWH
jgi:uracil-DNA glycosylase family 4